MTKLLVSVRDAREAQMAYQGGADLVDIKEPSRGSLGSADARMIEEIVAELGGKVPLSVALGELLSADSLPCAFEGQIHFAKFGLAGCASEPNWSERWRLAIDGLPVGVMPVAVAYADWRRAAAPDPWEVLSEAQARHCGALLLDTHFKGDGSLLEQVSLADLRSLIASAHKEGLLCVVAGSLGLDEISRVLPLRPDYVAVRGAACAGNRSGPLEAARVGRLSQLVHAVPGGISAPEANSLSRSPEAGRISFSSVRDKNA